MKRLLCKLGFHDWIGSFQLVMNPITFRFRFLLTSRKCQRCKKFEYFGDIHTRSIKNNDHERLTQIT